MTQLYKHDLDQWEGYKKRSQLVMEKLRVSSFAQLSERMPEISNLLNPSFCALLLYSTISEYERKAKSGMSFPLVYMILPIILHHGTCNRISSRTNMVVWLQRNPDTLVGFPKRARSLVSYANEAIEFLLRQQIVNIEDGKLTIDKSISMTKISKYIAADPEIADCINKTTHLGRWFFNMRSDESIYAAWGVRP